ncbi:ABC transporter ATP-binding protein [Oceanirhabdus sp. W0125-5]|uniref:ABC transporter ATP-binding protein n=1 Tax=Oceanirhabdus sp. W0125-5 TaxID=2999116 RepID=UPI0022F2F362|nr:ABC transporter ATP-binding protein [Oceanirhabdus sp. W0125-5]WBW97569.1 ABC transporter ATP-binding protein [Oceanirhabdus sp. W0125-5]
MENNKRSLIENIKYLIGQAWKIDRKIFFYVTIFTICGAVMPFIGIFTPKLLLDEITGAKRIEAIVLIIGLIFVISSIVNYLYNFTSNLVLVKKIKLKINISAKLRRKAMEIDLKHIEDKDTLNKYHAATMSCNSNSMGVEGMYDKLFRMIGRILAFGGYATIILTLSPLVLIYIILNVFIVYFVNTKARKYEYSLKEERAEYDRKCKYIYDTMSNFAYGKDIRIFNLNDWLSDKFSAFSENYVHLIKNINNKYFKASLLDIVLLIIREGIVYAYLIYCVIYKSMNIGDFTMYFATIAGFATWMQNIMVDISFLKSQNMYINDLRDFFEIDKNDGENNEENMYEEVPKDKPYEIEFRNVAFKYPHSERYIYENLSLKIKAGQKLAIVGINGAGKTTFIKLLTRLYEPTDGEILLNGINIKKFKKEEYFNLFSAVFQEVKIMAFSVAENVSLKEKEQIDRDRVVNCIERADIAEKINSLDNGIDTTLLKILDEKGTELSGGENQKLSLARALYKDGDIMVLDEPTAALDAIAEYKTYLSFNKLVGNKTAVYVSHRLASTRFCDVIAFFEDGKIKEYGTHDQLLKKNGRYKEMFEIQATYYKNEVEKEVAYES